MNSGMKRVVDLVELYMCQLELILITITTVDKSRKDLDEISFRIHLDYIQSFV